MNKGIPFYLYPEIAKRCLTFFDAAAVKVILLGPLIDNCEMIFEDV